MAAFVARGQLSHSTRDRLRQGRALHDRGGGLQHFALTALQSQCSCHHEFWRAPEHAGDARSRTQLECWIARARALLASAAQQCAREGATIVSNHVAIARQTRTCCYRRETRARTHSEMIVRAPVQTDAIGTPNPTARRLASASPTAVPAQRSAITIDQKSNIERGAYLSRVRINPASRMQSAAEALYRPTLWWIRSPATVPNTPAMNIAVQ